MILSTKETADAVIKMGVSKSESSIIKIFLMGIMGGIFIGVGFLAYFTVVQSLSTLSIGLAKLLGASTFPVGIVLCVLVGGSLFTGNNLLTLALFNKKISFLQLIRNWSVVWLGNLVGSVILAFIIFHTETLAKGPIFESVMAAVSSKTSYTFTKAVWSGFMCNILVTLAVWMSLAAKDVTGKILALWFPVMTFVLIGFEHSVANMFILSIGHMLNPEIYTLGEMFTINLIPVSIGNALSGGLFIPFIYWKIYYKKTVPVRVLSEVESA